MKVEDSIEHTFNPELRIKTTNRRYSNLRRSEQMSTAEFLSQPSQSACDPAISLPSSESPSGFDDGSKTTRACIRRPDRLPVAVCRPMEASVQLPELGTEQFITTCEHEDRNDS